MRIFTTISVVLVLAASAQAHFIWLVPQTDRDGAITVQVYFGEEAAPDDPAYLERIKDLKLSRVTGTQEPVVLEVKLDDDSLSAQDSGRGRALFIASHDLGVFDRGDSVFRLHYYAKTGPDATHEAWQATDCSDDLRLDITPSLSEGRLTVTAVFDGEPVEGAQVVATGPGLSEFEAETDDKGVATIEDAQPGLYSIRVRHIEAKAGELDGKTYPETRHYCTLALTVPVVPPVVAHEQVATLNQLVTSFGAAITDRALYLYGGHTGDAHSYSREEQSHALTRLNLDTGEWRTLAEGPHLQGLALVAHDGKLYRIGGFTAKNEPGEDHDLWSQDSVVCFDPAAGTWTEMPPLPEPRSSFDAAVLGDTIYVIGGWAMAGDEDNQWHTTAWAMDLSEQSPSWRPVATPPFQRRALAVAAHKGRIYAIGGMRQEGGPTRRVDVFDPKTGTWSEGPELIGDEGMTGFGASAFATGGHLYCSTIRGDLQRLSDDGTAWKLVARTPTARFFHRLLPVDGDRLLVVGGANMGIGKFAEIEILNVGEIE